MSAAWPRTLRGASQPPLSEASGIWPSVRTPSLAAVLGDHGHCEREEGGGAGRGGAGKTTFAHRLGSLAGLPVVALDEHFWQPGLNPLASDEWITLQRRLTSEVRWIMGGDLGPYDVLPGRLERADTSSCWTSTCSGAPGRHIGDQAKVGTSGWVICYRRNHRPRVEAAVARYAPQATFTVVRHPRALAHFLHEIADDSA